MRELQRVSGIGVQRAKELIEGGVTSLEALRQDEAAKAKLSRGELIGLKHVYDLEHRIPRAELAQLEALVLRAARAHEPPLEAVVCGSYRRGAAASGDIDVLLTHPSYQQPGEPEPRWLASLVAALEAEGFITDVIAQGAKKCAAVCILRPQHAAAAAAASTAAAAAATAAAAAAANGCPLGRLSPALAGPLATCGVAADALPQSDGLRLAGGRGRAVLRALAAHALGCTRCGARVGP